MHRAAAQKVQVEMSDRLAAVRTGVHHRAKAILQSLLCRNVSGYRMHMAEQSLVFERQMRERSDVLARDDQQMDGRLRVDIGDGECPLVFEDLLRWYGTSGNFAEEAIHAEQSNANVSHSPREVARRPAREPRVIVAREGASRGDRWMAVGPEDHEGIGIGYIE